MVSILVQLAIAFCLYFKCDERVRFREGRPASLKAVLRLCTTKLSILPSRQDPPTRQSPNHRPPLFGHCIARLGACPLVNLRQFTKPNSAMPETTNTTEYQHTSNFHVTSPAFKTRILRPPILLHAGFLLDTILMCVTLLSKSAFQSKEASRNHPSGGNSK